MVIKKGDHIRESKVSRARDLVNSGVYDRMLPDIAESLVSGDTPQSRKFLAAVGVHERIQEETRQRANLSFYAAMASALFGFFLVGTGVVLLWYGDLASAFLISSVGGAISAFITKTFLKIHEVSLKQLNRFSKPMLTEVLTATERAIDGLPDPGKREEARIKAIGTLLKILETSRLNLSA